MFTVIGERINTTLKKVQADIECMIQGPSMMTTKDSEFNSHWNAAFQKYRDSGKFSQLCRDSWDKHSELMVVCSSESTLYCS